MSRTACTKETIFLRKITSHSKKDLQNIIQIQTVYDISANNGATFTCKEVKTIYLLATNILFSDKKKTIDCSLPFGKNKHKFNALH